MRLEKVVPASPEFYPYAPSWGRLTEEHAEAFRKDIVNLKALGRGLNPAHREELAWLENYLQFALLLDECGRKIEAAYTLKEGSLAGEITGETLARQAEAARKDLDAAPLEELFKSLRAPSALAGGTWRARRHQPETLAGSAGIAAVPGGNPAAVNRGLPRPSGKCA